MLRSVIDRLRLLRDLWRRRMAMWRWDRINDTNGSFVDRVVFVRWDAKHMRAHGYFFILERVVHRSTLKVVDVSVNSVVSIRC